MSNKKKKSNKEMRQELNNQVQSAQEQLNNLSQGEREGLHTFSDDDLARGYNLLRENKPVEGAESNSYLTRMSAYKSEASKRGIDLDNYVPSTKVAPANTEVAPAKDRSNLKFDDIVQEVIPGADPNNLTDEQKDLVADAIANEPGYTPKDRTKAILGDERIAGIMAKRDADNANTDKPVGDGLLDRLKATSADLNERKADPKAEYTGIPGENAQGNALGYRSVINDAKDLAYANNDLKAARLNDSVRQEAIAAKKEAKSVANDIKKYDREYTQLLDDLEGTNKKSEKMLIKA